MSRKRYWGFASLIILLSLFSTFVIFVNKGGKSFEKLEAELRQLSLKEIIPRLTDVKLEHVRKLAEESEWFTELVEQGRRELSNEEETALQALERRVFPELAKGYEKLTGHKAPPPGYTHHWKDGEPAQLIKYNTPNVTIDPMGAQGYQNWHQLTDAEYRRYLVLNAIANGSVDDLQISQEVVELAKAWKQPLYEKSWGYIPSVSVNSIYTREKTPEEEALEEKLISEARAKIDALKPKTISEYHDNDVKAVVNELKTALNQR